MNHRAAIQVCALSFLLWHPGALAGQAPAPSWQALDARVSELYSAGDLKQAIEAAQAALNAASSPKETGRSQDRLGFLYYTSGDFANGQKYLRESLQTRESAFGADSLDAAETDNDLAMLLRDQRHMDDARALAEHAVAIRERLLGSHALPFAEALDTVGTVHGLAGDYTGAVLQFERAVSIHEERPAGERETEEYGTLCVNLAGTYQRLGNYDAAEATFRKGLDALRIRPGISHPAYAASELALASLEVDLGRYDEAERLYDEGGRLVASELGDQHPFYAAFLNNRGFFYQSIGNLTAAAADYEHSLEIKRKLYGPESPLAVATLRNLAHLTYAVDREKGERLLTEAVHGYSSMSNAPPFDYASVLVGLARAERERGAVDEARATAEKARDVSRMGLGERHPLLAAATRELGLALAASGRVDDAERELREALSMAEAAHGPSHPDVAGFVDALGDFYVARGAMATAEPLYARSLAIQDRYVGDILAIGSESFKAASMSAASDPVPRLIAFQAEAPDLASARALAFEAVTRRKGRIVDQVKAWRERLVNAPAPVQKRVSEWQSLVACRTSLTVALGYRDLKPGLAGSCSLPATDLAGKYERLLSDLRSRWTADLGTQAVEAIKVLQTRADALETSLNRDARTAVLPERVTVDDLRSRLRPNEALIEFVAFSPFRPFRAGPGGREYGAFVLTRSGRLRWADLGPAAHIDTAVGDLLTAARDWSVSVARHEAAAAGTSMQTADDAMRELSRAVWHPVKPLIDPTVTQLRIAPDGLLNLVPFEALADPAALIGRFTISYLPAGRDLATASAPSRSGAPVIVVSPGPASAGTQAPTSIATSFRADLLGHLDAAAAEAADIRRLMPRARVLTGSSATERRVKQLQAPSLLHLVGHGVVRSGADCSGKPCVSSALGAPAQAMTLAAMVLEEAYGRGAGSSEDGLLTAVELQDMDLRGTEMLVLSQCQMASGLASVGEGVYGMRRAATIAGANTFVAPLWNVDDEVQRRLMRAFYAGLAAGQSRGDALRRAKLALRSAARTHSFLYWAPVILSGSAATVPAAMFQ